MFGRDVAALKAIVASCLGAPERLVPRAARECRGEGEERVLYPRLTVIAR